MIKKKEICLYIEVVSNNDWESDFGDWVPAFSETGKLYFKDFSYEIITKQQPNGYCIIITTSNSWTTLTIDLANFVSSLYWAQDPTTLKKVFYSVIARWMRKGE